MIQVTIIGRIVAEPAWVQSQNTSVKSLKVLVSCNTDVKNKESGYYVSNLFICHFWGRQAETVAGSFDKGGKIAVTGKAKLCTWKDTKTGDFRAAVDVTAAAFDWVGDKADMGSVAIGPSGGDIAY